MNTLSRQPYHFLAWWKDSLQGDWSLWRYSTSHVRPQYWSTARRYGRYSPHLKRDIDCTNRTSNPWTNPTSGTGV